ncbi:hypothetical protein GO003_023490 [Methylicorpusculum oleiharenae]|jgi:hypothetical protein|uniref:hypothetical protein n=1 Tax=Methylicorpusculum oleiharenae TaxID=1338687 RepID=UPI001359CEBF|nr:hypothetical protein [Methylicorpusculum oleiharenae]MBS3952558.1 hypothetical protein [Methylomicrobium sp.]MCD2453348.1 hypothetical protein [Methylicorpusculum oleiharenae]
MGDRLAQHILESSSVRKITVKLPSSLKSSLPVRILNDGYNMRQKSKWVVEAINELLSREGWEGALLSELMIKPNAQDVFSVPESVVNKINQEAHRVALLNPSLNATQSSIIRAAINRRMLGLIITNT